MDTFSTNQSAEDNANVESEQATIPLTFKVGEREFDAESAAKKIQHADAYIVELKEQQEKYQAKMAEMEAALAKATKLEEALSKMQNKAEPKANENTTQFGPEEVSKSAEEIVNRILQEREQKAMQEAMTKAKQESFMQVQQRLSSVYGADKVDQVVKEKAEELGISFKKAIEMAQDPEESKVLLRLLDVPSSTAKPAPSGQLNAQGLGNRQKPETKWSQLSSMEMAKKMQTLKN